MRKKRQQEFEQDNFWNIHRESPPGAAPGFLAIPEHAASPVVTLISYDKNSYTSEILNLSENQDQIFNLNFDTEKKYWLEISGLGDKKFLESVAERFQIHRLVLEDVINQYQRPKLDEYPGHLFLTSRMLKKQDSITQVKNEQLSLFLGKNFVLTFVTGEHSHFDPVKSRLQQGKGNIRIAGSDYLAYAIMDSVVDYYFPILEEIGEKLDDLEIEFLMRPQRFALKNLMLIKRQLIVFRRTIWAERDKINDLIRTDTEYINDNTRVYLRDTYDHCVQILDLVESYKEITASMMDIYLSSINNRMNEIMKVLAVISTIFIPLTFIVGVYGMNFSRTDPVTGKVLPLNMPELYSPYGYPAIWGIMAGIVIIQIIIFYRKGWMR